MKDKIITVTIGDVLMSYLEDYNLTQSELAIKLNTPFTIINEVIQGKRRLNSKIDLRLCQLFNKSNGYFLRIQHSIDSRKYLRK